MESNNSNNGDEPHQKSGQKRKLNELANDDDQQKLGHCSKKNRDEWSEELELEVCIYGLKKRIVPAQEHSSSWDGGTYKLKID
jgi:hypothetical protein